jgi:hypothetical protein
MLSNVRISQVRDRCMDQPESGVLMELPGKRQSESRSSLALPATLPPDQIVGLHQVENVYPQLA